MGDHSMLIYAYKICAKLNIKTPHIVSDQDSFDSPFDIGIIRTRNPKLMETHVKKSGLFKSAVCDENQNYIITLNTTFKANEINEIEKQEIKRQLSNGKIVTVEYSDPSLARALSNASIKAHVACANHLDKITASSNGIRLINDIDRVLFSYYQLATSKKNKFPAKVWDEMISSIHNAIIELEIIGNLGQFSHSTLMSIGELLLDVKKRLKNNRVYHALKEEEKNNE